MRSQPDRIFLPRILRQSDQMFSVYTEDPAYESGDLSAPGPRHRMQMLTKGYEYINELNEPS